MRGWLTYNLAGNHYPGMVDENLHFDTFANCTDFDSAQTKSPMFSLALLCHTASPSLH